MQFSYLKNLDGEPDSYSSAALYQASLLFQSAGPVRFFLNFLFFNCYNFLFNFFLNFLFFKCYNMQLNTVLAIATITVLANCNYHGLGVLNVNMQDRYVRMRLILTFWNTHSSLRTSTIYVTPYHYFSYIF